MNTQPYEFDCQDCRSHVFSWPLGYENPRERCFVCQWIYERPHLTPEEIAEIRIMTCTAVQDNG